MRQDTDTRTGTPLEGSDIDGRYKLKTKLGEGGMGVVYKAQQISTNREVAFKIVKLDLGDDARIARFQQEVDIISQLSHPNVVRVFDTGTLPNHDLLYVVMEYIDGISLGDVLWHKHAEDQYFKCRTRVEFALEVIYQLCAALTEPHRQDIIHRDIKPENIILAPSSDETIQVKVLDFGIARVLNDKSTRKKMTDARVPFVGTPHYMAPEQVARSQYDARTDLYAVGVILYEMLTGQYPFDDENVLAILLRKTQKSPPSILDHIPEGFAYPEIVALTDSLLAIDIARRPADAIQVRRIIEDIRDKYRMRRVRVRAESYLARETDEQVERGLMDDDERLEPLRGLYRKWLLYPSGRALVPDAEIEDDSNALASLGDLSGFGAPAPANHPSQSFLPEPVSEAHSDMLAQAAPITAPVEPISEVDEEEDIESHTDILSSPKRQHLKAWSLDAEWSKEFDVEQLHQGSRDIDKLEAFFEEEEQDRGDVEEAVTSIWSPDAHALPEDLRRSFAGEVDWNATFPELGSMADTRQEASLPSEAQVVLGDEDMSVEGVVPAGFLDNLRTGGANFGAEPAAITSSSSSESPGFQRLELNSESTQSALQMDEHGLPYDTMQEPLGQDSELLKRLMEEKKAVDEGRKKAPSLEDLTGEHKIHGAADTQEQDPRDIALAIKLAQQASEQAAASRNGELRTPQRTRLSSAPSTTQDSLELADVSPSVPSAHIQQEADRIHHSVQQREEQAQAARQKNIIIALLFIALVIVAAIALGTQL